MKTSADLAGVNCSIFGARHPFRGAAFGLSHGLFLDVLTKLKLVADTNGELGTAYSIQRLSYSGFQFHMTVELKVCSVREVVFRASVSKGVTIFAAFGEVITFRADEGDLFLVAFHLVVIGQLEPVAKHPVAYVGVCNCIRVGEVNVCVVANDLEVIQEPTTPAVLSFDVPQVHIGISGGCFLIITNVSGSTTGEALEQSVR